MKYVISESIVPDNARRKVYNKPNLIFDEEQFAIAIRTLGERCEWLRTSLGGSPFIEHMERMDDSQENMVVGAIYYVQDAGECWYLQLDFVTDNDPRVKAK